MRGEQETLEKSHPLLAEKAKKFLGFECYFELSACKNGVAMKPGDPFFMTLKKK